MRVLRVISLAAALLPALACAQWQWIDKDGRKVFSDRSPPPEIPAKSILKQPGGKAAPLLPPTEALESGAAPAGPAVVAKAAASAPKISGTDKTLEDKKKQAEQADLAKKKAEEEKVAQAKAENCEQAKRALQVVVSGVRIRIPNAKGELEYLTDAQRVSETKRLQDITAGCKT